MSEINKVFGIGMSKTGTTTLGRCLELLSFTPHVGFHPQLKRWVEQKRDMRKVLRYAERFRSFEDSPWYLIYQELDRAFPQSKFILTIRKDSLTHANSSWAHGVRRGVRSGKATSVYINEKIKVYEDHNNAVLEYFRHRPQDLLVLCWEDGDGWEKLCPFLGVAIPDSPIPHCNQGRRFNWPSYLSSLQRVYHWASRTSVVRLVKNSLRIAVKLGIRLPISVLANYVKRERCEVTTRHNS